MVDLNFSVEVKFDDDAQFSVLDLSLQVFSKNSFFIFMLPYQSPTRLLAET